MIFYDKLFTKGIKDIDEVVELINNHYEVSGLKVMVYYKEAYNLFEVVSMKYIFDILYDKKFIILGFCYKKEDVHYIINDMFQYFYDEKINILKLKEHMRLYL
ncbi:MAG: hypothetical protein ACK5LY_03765 [Lachnospirales bacterium]